MFFGQEMKINGFADTAAPPSGWSTALEAFNIIWPVKVDRAVQVGEKYKLGGNTYFRGAEQILLGG